MCRPRYLAASLLAGLLLSDMSGTWRIEILVDEDSTNPDARGDGWGIFVDEEAGVRREYELALRKARAP